MRSVQRGSGEGPAPPRPEWSRGSLAWAWLRVGPLPGGPLLCRDVPSSARILGQGSKVETKQALARTGQGGGAWEVLLGRKEKPRVLQTRGLRENVGQEPGCLYFLRLGTEGRQ